MTTKALVGFIGLGVMGRPMATNLMKAGFPMVVSSRSRAASAELVDAGATWMDTPAEVAKQASVVITMLPDTPDVEDVMVGSHGVLHELRRGSLVIDMSTIAPLAARRVGQMIEERQAAFLDAPVSGGQLGAVDGSLTIMVGGQPAAFQRARPLLEAMGKRVTLVGPIGAGQVAKACNQLIVAANIEAVAEALVLAAAAGVDPARVRDALLGGFASSRVLEVHGQRMLGHDFSPGFRAVLHRKDARIVAELADTVGSPVPMFEVVRIALDHLVDRDGKLDHSALVTLRELDAGIDLTVTSDQAVSHRGAADRPKEDLAQADG